MYISNDGTKYYPSTLYVCRLNQTWEKLRLSHVFLIVLILIFMCATPIIIRFSVVHATKHKTCSNIKVTILKISFFFFENWTSALCLFVHQWTNRQRADAETIHTKVDKLVVVCIIQLYLLYIFFFFLKTEHLLYFSLCLFVHKFNINIAKSLKKNKSRRKGSYLLGTGNCLDYTYTFIVLTTLNENATKKI